MSKKTMIFQNKIVDENKSLIEQELVNLIDKALKEKLIELAIDDIKIIANQIMPDLDAMISEKVKKHLYEIGLFMVNKFNIGE